MEGWGWGGTTFRQALPRLSARGHSEAPVAESEPGCGNPPAPEPTSTPARARRPQREAQPAHVGGGGTGGLGVLLTQAVQVSQSVPPRQADTYLKRNAKVRLTRKAIQC